MAAPNRQPNRPKLTADAANATSDAIPAGGTHAIRAETGGPGSVSASSVERGWVPQAWGILAEQGIRYRVVNLSISGATVIDVIEREIPAMNGLAAAPATSSRKPSPAAFCPSDCPSK